MHLHSLKERVSHKRRPIPRREALQRIQAYTDDPPRRSTPTLEESIRLTGLPDPTLLEIVHRETRRRMAEALRLWVDCPCLEHRMTFLRAAEAMSVSERALRHRERESWEQPTKATQLVAFLPEAS
jgi:hypothetical protein